MNRILRIALALLALLLSDMAAAESNRTLAVEMAGSQRIALVIGNSAYPGVGALKNPANDARDIAAKLRRLGFEVIVKTDLRQKEMLRALTDFGEKLRPGSEALFFYAGHGMQVRGRNYLIPVDAEIRSEGSVSSEAVDVDQLLDKLVPARLSMVILDACRNNPFEQRFRGGGQGLAQINAPSGTLIAYSTAPGKVAADGKGRNGLYTAELLAAMDVPGIKIEDVFKRVRASVIDRSQGGQTPWESSSLTGDFFFIPTQSDGYASSPHTISPPDPAALELAFWKSVERGNTSADYSAYLEKYPDGQFSDLARNRLKRPEGGSSLALARPTPIPASGESIKSLPLPRVGDYWRYRGSNQNGSDNPTYTVSAVRPNAIEIRYVSNANEHRTLTLDTDWNVVAEAGQTNVGEIRFTPAAPYQRYPLEPGQTWRGTYKAECGLLCSFEVNYEYRVVGWETVTVPAGTYQALHIESTDRYRYNFGGVTGVGVRHAWLVPEIGHPVKFTYAYNAKPLHAYELQEYRRQRQGP